MNPQNAGEKIYVDYANAPKTRWLSLVCAEHFLSRIISKPNWSHTSDSISCIMTLFGRNNHMSLSVNVSNTYRNDLLSHNYIPPKEEISRCFCTHRCVIFLLNAYVIMGMIGKNPLMAKHGAYTAI